MFQSKNIFMTINCMTNHCVVGKAGYEWGSNFTVNITNEHQKEEGSENWSLGNSRDYRTRRWFGTIDDNWVRPVKKQWSHFPSLPLTPRSLIFRKVTPMSTLSNALAKSRYVMSTGFPSSRSRVIRSKCSKSWLRHDRPLLNPCWDGLKRWFSFMK